MGGVRVERTQYRRWGGGHFQLWKVTTDDVKQRGRVRGEGQKLLPSRKYPCSSTGAPCAREHQQCGGGANQFDPFVIFSPRGWCAASGGGGVPVEVTWPSSKRNARLRGFQLPLLIYMITRINACDHMAALKMKISSAFRRRLWGVKIPTQVILKEDEGKSLKMEEEVSQQCQLRNFPI